MCGLGGMGGQEGGSGGLTVEWGMGNVSVVVLVAVHRDEAIDGI